MNWRVVFSIAQKDLVDALKNLYLLFTMVMPIGMSLLFQVVIPDEKEMGQVKIVLFDPASSRLSANLQAHTDIEIITASSAEQVSEKVYTDKEISGGVVIPAGFDAALDAGEKPEVRVIVNPKATGIQQSIFRAAIVDQTWLLVRQEFPVQFVWEGDGSDNQASGQSSTTQNGLNAPFNINTYLLLVVLLMGLTMVGSFVVPTLMVEEKEKHTLEALLVSPAGPAEVALGKAIVGMVYSLLVGGILLAMNNGFAGNWPITSVAIILGSLFIVGVGLLMGSFFKVMHQVNIASSVVMLAMIMPSWVTVFSMPAPFDKLLMLIPTSYLGKVLELSLSGKATLSNTWVDLGILAASTVVVFAAIVWALRRERK